MNLYRLPDGTWVGTQAEWKVKAKEMGFAANVAPEPIDVPINPKADLIAFLNARNEERSQPRFDPNAEVGTEPPATTVPAPSPLTGVELDNAFAAAPLNQRLRLAVTAIDGASAMLGAAMAKIAELTRPTQ